MGTFLLQRLYVQYPTENPDVVLCSRLDESQRPISLNPDMPWHALDWLVDRPVTYLLGPLVEASQSKPSKSYKPAKFILCYDSEGDM
jgi:hypothetical protein